MPRKKPLLRRLGPGLVTGAADDDPSGIATYSQAGAQFGYALLWTVFLTTPFMIAIQLVSAHIGRVTGAGIVASMRTIAPRRLVLAIVMLLVAANTINIAANLAAMAEALSLVIGGLRQEHSLIFFMGSMLLQIFVPYRHYSPVLKWLTFVLFVYVATAFIVKVDWIAALRAALLPTLSLKRDYLLMVVAVLGTTISPYLFFWQASHEVEEMRIMRSRPLRILRGAARTEFTRMALDTSVGMILSNTIAFFIMLTTAATLHQGGITDIRTAADAANALRPIAGEFAFALFALGIIGTGLLAIPVLAGSAAYGVAEAMGWPATLEAKAPDAKGFYGIIAAATIVGFSLGFTPIDPIQLLIWSAVINGIVAVPIMAVMLVVGTHKSIMGRFAIGRRLATAGWIATALMALTVLAMFASLV